MYSSVVASGNPQVCSDLCVRTVLYVCECTCACVFSDSMCVVLQTVLAQMCLSVFVYSEAVSICEVSFQNDYPTFPGLPVMSILRNLLLASKLSIISNF